MQLITSYKTSGAGLNDEDGNLQSPQQESALVGYEAYLASDRYDGGAACADVKQMIAACIIAACFVGRASHEKHDATWKRKCRIRGLTMALRQTSSRARACVRVTTNTINTGCS